MASKARDIADLGSNDVLETTSTGVDVTGTVTADGLTVNGDATLDAVELTTSSSFPTTGFTLNSNGFLYGMAGSQGFILRSESNSKALLNISSQNDVSFYEDTGTTAKMVWDASAESLGIGTSSPTGLIHSNTPTIGYATLKLSRTGSSEFEFQNGISGVTGDSLSIKDVSLSHDYLTLRSGNVGIGTASPSGKLSISGSSGDIIELTKTSNNQPSIKFNGASSDTILQGGDVFQVYTGGSERARLDSSGNLLVGTTASSSKWVAGNGVDRGFEARGAGLIVSHTSYENQLLNTDNITAHIRFYYRGSATGSINTSGSGTVYATTSDYRLKENVVALDSASDRVKALKPCRFNFIADPDSTVDGFLAHEAQEVVPEAVTGTKDAVDAEGNPEYQGIDQSKLVPLLTKALQEALTKIEQLETRIETLETAE